MKAWLSDLPTTALVTLTGCVLALLTAGFYFGATLSGRAIAEGAWALWLAFVAAMLGVGYAQFAKKRETYIPTPVRHDDGGRPPLHLED